MLRRFLYTNTLAFSLCFGAMMLIALPCADAAVRYSVAFEGLEDPVALKTIKSLAQLTSLKKRPPPSVNALRYRAESDIPEIIKVLHAHGYLEATVNIRLQLDGEFYLVIISMSPGPRYTIDKYNIHFICSEEECASCPQITPKELGVDKGEPALAQTLIQAELDILHKLSECGYPLAAIEKRNFTANGDTKTVSVTIDVATHALTRFGTTTIEGLTSVKPKFIGKKKRWKRDAVYDNRKVEETQTALIDTGLFSSVLITHGQTLDPDGTIPMNIDVMETKHRSINIGASYQTHFGPGLTFGWEHRNIVGMGQKLSIRGDATRTTHSGVAVYQIPEFGAQNQDFFIQAQALHEDIRAYAQRTYNLGNRLERSFDLRFRYSFGAKLERLLVTDSVQNGNYLLVEFPVYLRWSNSNSLLNPTKGITIEYVLVPTINTTDPKQCYLYQKLVPCFYIPVTTSHSVVFAHKFTFGTIFSPELSSVPVPKRFLGGSDEDLRGYEYLTVSPLRKHHHHRKPIGGRSAVYYSFETRLRVSETIGLVPFFDIGNVELESFIHFKGKWYKSVGIGGRYFSFLGPLRVDVGFPLDRRKKIDSRYRILVSIGQMF